MGLIELYNIRLVLENKLNDLKQNLRKFAATKQNFENEISSANAVYNSVSKNLNKEMKSELSAVSPKSICEFHGISTLSYILKTSTRKMLLEKDLTDTISSRYAKVTMEAYRDYNNVVLKQKPLIDNLSTKILELSNELESVKAEIKISDTAIERKVSEIDVLIAENKVVIPADMEVYLSYRAELAYGNEKESSRGISNIRNLGRN